MNKKSKISLLGFKNLDDSEIQRCQDLVAKKLERLERELQYDLLKLQLKQHSHEHKHGVYFVHEILGDLYFGSGHIHASYSGKNLYLALARVLEKLDMEVQHHLRKNKPKL